MFELPRVGHHGFKYDARYGQVQTYTDGTPILPGDRCTSQQTPGGLLPPGPPVEGTAMFSDTVGFPGELLLQTDDGRFYRLTHIVRKVGV